MVKAAYPMRFREVRSFNPTFMYPALSSGEVDVISAFSSDGRIAANGAVPPYDAMILVAPERVGDDRFMSAIEPLLDAITVENMREANYKVDRNADKVSPLGAARWLDQRIRDGEDR